MSLKMFASFVIKSMDIRFGIIIILGELINCLNCQRFDFLPKGQDCPLSKEEWEKRSNARSCNSNTPYHCLKNQDGELGEVCVKRSMVEIGQCPIYLTSIKLIDFRHCKPFEGYTCATAPFISNTSFQHQACLRFPTSSTSTEKIPVTTRFTTPSTNGSSGSPTAVILLLLLILIVVGIGLVWWFYLRKNYNCRIPNPFTGGAITICHKEVKEFSDAEEEKSLAGSAEEPVKEDTYIHVLWSSSFSGENQNKKQLEKKIKRSNPNFMETKNYREIIAILENNNVVLVVGNTGIGKSTTCVGVLEHYKQKLEWKTIHFPLDAMDKAEERTIVLVDVTFGELSLFSGYDPNIENMMNRLFTSTRECKEFKVLITSSSSLMHCQNNFPILKGCSELSMSYSISDLKNLYEKYTKPKLDVVNDTEDMSEERSTSNQVLNEDKSSDKAKDASNYEDYEISSAFVNDNDKTENQINLGQKLSESVRSPMSDDGSPKSSIDPQQSLESDIRNDTNIVGDHNQTSTEDICNGNEEDRKSSRDPGIYCAPIQEIGEDGEIDLSKVEIEIIYDNEEGNLEENEDMIQKVEETWRESNVSEFGLPKVCYVPGGIEWNVPPSEALDVMSSFEIYVNNLADSDNGLDRQKYKTLVYIMLNGSTVDSKSLHKKLLSEIDQDLTPDRFLARAYELAQVGVLDKKGKLYSFHNDLLLFAVIHSFASRDIRTFTSYCYLPFIMQFLRPKSNHLSNHFIVEVDVDWETLCKFGCGFVKRKRGNGNEFQEFELYQIFRDRLQFHEEGIMKFYKIDKTTVNEKGNAFVRKMVNHYPELREYYFYAEPARYRSIPELAFKPTVKKQPPCTVNKNDFTKK